MKTGDAIVEILNELDETPINDEAERIYGRLGEDVLEVLELATEDDEDESLGLIHLINVAHEASTMGFKLVRRDGATWNAGPPAVEELVDEIIKFFD